MSQGSEGRPPTGTISKTITFSRLSKSSFRARIRSVATAIDRTHRVPELPMIPVRSTKTETRDGGYRKEMGTGKPVEIEISRRGSTPELTFVHEIGHFLDEQAIPGSVRGVRSWYLDPNLKSWRDVVLESRPIKILIEKAEDGDPGEPGRKIACYLRTDREIWARSYAQFVAIRSGDPILMKHLEECRSPRSPWPLQWSDDEFGPVEAEIDALFKAIGWVQ